VLRLITFVNCGENLSAIEFKSTGAGAIGELVNWWAGIKPPPM
jgi:hypothetical protein